MAEPTGTVTIGEFSRLTHLSVRTLHHYHAEGVLAPSAVDPATGYRRYGLDQLAAAQLVRRLRAVRMPVPQLRAVVLAPDDATRQALIAAHLGDLRRELAETAAAVSSLQSLLSGAGSNGAVAVSVRALPDLSALTCTADVTRESVAAWCADVFPQLYAAAGRAGGATGPGGACYDDTWFEQDAGRVTAFVPVAAPGADVVRGGRYAVALHAGAFTELDRTYAALGREVVRLGGDLTGPIVERYLVTPADTSDPRGLRTEVCWPLPPQEES
jgi:DNA-binding transcriptional MerR regulator